MTERKGSSREYFRVAWYEFAARSRGHLKDEALIDYHRGHQNLDQQQAVESHLAQCADCLKTLTQMSDFVLSSHELVSPPPRSRVSDQEFEDFWQRIESEITKPSAATDHRGSTLWMNSRAIFALVASLLLVFALTGIWALSLWRENQRLTQRKSGETLAGRLENLGEELRQFQEQITALEQERIVLNEQNRNLQDQLRTAEQSYEAQVARLQQPEINVPIQNIYPLGDVQRSGRSDSINRIQVPSGTRSFTLIMTDYQRGYRDYRIELVDQAGETVWQGRGLRPDRAGDLTLKLDRTFLAQSQYTLKLYGQNDLIAEFRLSIR